MDATEEREADARLAVEVLGWQRFPYMMPRHVTEGRWIGGFQYCPPGEVHCSTIREVPHFHRDGNAMVTLLSGMLAKGWHHIIEDNVFGQSGAVCTFWRDEFRPDESIAKAGDTLMEAVAKAATAALAPTPETP